MRIMSDLIKIHVDRRTKARLERLAQAADCTTSDLAAEALRSFVDENESRIASHAARSAPEHEHHVFLRQWRQRLA
jgi:predicted transcriptional regulator